MKEAADDPRTPVTLLTGWLGSGKTTLLNRLLQNPGGRKFAVLVNEFGEIGYAQFLDLNKEESPYNLPYTA